MDESTPFSTGTPTNSFGVLNAINTNLYEFVISYHILFRLYMFSTKKGLG
jgi:hypothetical protein